MKNLFLLTILSLALAASGGKLEITAYENIAKEKVAQAAKLNGISLQRVGTGIRQKRVLFNINVYRASLFVNNPAAFVKKTEGLEALNSLEKMDAYALNLQFLRDVGSKDVLNSFNEGMQINGVKASASVEQLKKAVQTGGDLKAGDSIRISVDNKQGVLIYEQGNSYTEIKGDKELFNNMFSIWLGKTNENNMLILRKSLIGL